jgi:hypothetical protein
LSHWCPRIWPSISTTISTAKNTLFRPGVLSRVLYLGPCDDLREGGDPGGRSRFGHLEVSTMHRDGDKPGKIPANIPTLATTPNRPCGRCRGGVDHGDHGYHCLQPVGGLHFAPEEKLVALSHEEKNGSCCFFLAVQY